jgi:hypothetical protein
VPRGLTRKKTNFGFATFLVADVLLAKESLLGVGTAARTIGVLCRTYGARSVAVLNPGLPAWAMFGAGPPGLCSDIHLHFALSLPKTFLATLNDRSAGP